MNLAIPLAAGPKSAVQASKSVLVVEDEDIVRRVVARRLKACTYNVLEAACGPEALALVEHHKGPLDLVITDVIMPKMNGRELVEALRNRYPNVSVLFMSGYPRDIIASQGLLTPGIHFIEK